MTDHARATHALTDVLTAICTRVKIGDRLRNGHAPDGEFARFQRAIRAEEEALRQFAPVVADELRGGLDLASLHRDLTDQLATALNPARPLPYAIVHALCQVAGATAAYTEIVAEHAEGSGQMARALAAGDEATALIALRDAMRALHRSEFDGERMGTVRPPVDATLRYIRDWDGVPS